MRSNEAMMVTFVAPRKPAIRRSLTFFLTKVGRNIETGNIYKIEAKNSPNKKVNKTIRMNTRYLATTVEKVMITSLIEGVKTKLKLVKNCVRKDSSMKSGVDT